MLLKIVPFLLWTQFCFGQSTSARGTPTYTGKSESTNSQELPVELKGVTIEEKIGQKIDLNLMVYNEKGESVPLSSYFSPHKPILLSPMYYACPGLCSFHFNGVIESLKKVDWNPGEKFQVIAFSFDPKETFDLGVKKKTNYMKMYDRKGTENGFHFITAPPETITALMNQVGFQYKWNEAANEWSHASAAIMISPEGIISRYLHGVEFDPRDMKLALNETANGKVGNLVDSVILYCFKYDQHESKYGLQAFRVMQLGGAVMVLILAIWLFPVLLRSRREKV